VARHHEVGVSVFGLVFNSWNFGYVYTPLEKSAGGDKHLHFGEICRKSPRDECLALETNEKWPAETARLRNLEN
jgi:hypothetical protein